MEYADGLLSKIMGDGLEWTVMTTQAPAVLNTFQMEMFIFVIGPESDHSLFTLVTNSLTHSLTD